jgi:hypothetical protein
MKLRKFVHFAGVVSIIAGAMLGRPGLAQAAPRNEPDAPQDIPDNIVGSGVSYYAIASPRVVWADLPEACPPGFAAASANGEVAPSIVPSGTFAEGVQKAPASASSVAGIYDESIQRVSLYGSEPRTLLSRSNQFCGQGTVQSNIVADDSFVYYTSNAGLVRLSVNANPGDQPELVTDAVKGYTELAMDGTNVFIIKITSYAGNGTSQIWKVNKATKVPSLLTTRSALPGNLQVSYGNILFGGENYMLYWIEGSTLMRFNLNTSALGSIATSVSAYHAEGGRFSCTIQFCTSSDLVFIARNSGSEVVTYNNSSGNTGAPLYTTSERIYGIVVDGNNMFLLQDYTDPCGQFFCNHVYRVVRRGRGSGGSADVLYSTAPTVYFSLYNLKAAGDFIFWQEGESLRRLFKNAAALPQINMRVTGFSITQGIQTPTNGVGLIRDRRTFVRAFVKSDGPGSVSGVTARLYRLGSNNQVLDSVMPVNSVGTNLTVRTNPQRSNINDSFVFELPWNWVAGTSVRLRVVLNPYRYPIEPNYNDDVSDLGTFGVKASPALNVRFVSWGYTVNGTDYDPRIVKDILQSYSWILRAYPLSSRLVFNDSNTPGFHPRLFFQYDAGLGARVMGTHSSCQDLLWKDSNNVQHDDRNLCASRYTNQQANWIRIIKDGIFQALFNPKFYYGMISDGAAFPRGQACCGSKLSTGPAGSGTWGWDNDGSYADWYAAHEIGHTLGRAHPSPSATSCGNSASDNSYPYTGAQIGSSNDFEGFDAGDSFYSVPRAIYPGTTWFDVMSYCSNQWISDYTYRGMYNFMTGGPLVMSAQDEEELPRFEQQPDDGQKMLPFSSQGALVSGDWVLVQGMIINGTNTASLQKLTRLSETAGIPALVPGAYSIRLTDNGGNTLADYPFTPTPGDETTPDLMGISQIVTMTAGARQLRIVRLSDNLTLATQAISANAPAVSNVALQGAPNPVTGTVTLAWSASDADGDALTFDVFYSNDGGATFTGVQSNLSGNSAQIDTASLAGGSGFFRVFASDGVNIGQADSPPYTFASKPPMPMILTPGNNHTVNFGQLVNFSGAAMDWQDGSITGANLVWSNQNGVLGTGELLSVSSLPVGVNTITLKATNSAGQSAETTITVIVNDDLSLLGPTMTAGPTQFDWAFPADATTPAQQVLHLGNAGSDTTAQFAVSVNVPWLAVTPGNGTLPGDITLTADPTNVSNGNYESGTVTVLLPAASGTPEQTINIPVSLSKGFNPSNPKGQTPQFKIFAPVTVR